MELRNLNLLWAVLLTMSMTSCKAPKMERTPKIFVPDSGEMSLVRLMDEKEKKKDCIGEIEKNGEQRICVIPYEQADFRFSCLSNDDSNMLYSYVATLVMACKRWRKVGN